MYDTIYDVCIIGAGASGLVSAIESSRRGLSCIVIDKNKKAGRKLYATGNGRCNLTNDEWDDTSYYGNPFPDAVFDALFKKIDKHPRSFVVDYFDFLGIKTTDKDGYVYPASLEASSVVWALNDTALNFGTVFLYDHRATKISEITVENVGALYEIAVEGTKDKEDNQFVLARNLIIACGGSAAPGIGSADPGETEILFDSACIPYNSFAPALCPVHISEDMSSLAGVRTKARVTASGHSEFGELQITDYGISGIVVFNLAYYMEQGEEVQINIIPRVSEEDFIDSFKDQQGLYPDRSLILFLNGYINDKLCSYFAGKVYGEIRPTLKDINENGIRTIYEEMSNWTLKVLKKAGFDSCQAVRGGIVTSVINPSTMRIEADRCLGERLFAVGEATDVLGKCGGYNLTYAFITGYLAGRSVK